MSQSRLDLESLQRQENDEGEDVPPSDEDDRPLSYSVQSLDRKTWSNGKLRIVPSKTNEDLIHICEHQ